MLKLKGTCHCEAVQWTFEGSLESVTACNCTTCRRYGALWAYGYDGDEIRVSGTTQVYMRGSKSLGYHFCGNCGGMAYWRGTEAGKDGKRRIAVNTRFVTEPERIESLLIDHFDGFDTFDDLPRDGRCVKDMWF